MSRQALVPPLLPGSLSLVGTSELREATSADGFPDGGPWLYGRFLVAVNVEAETGEEVLLALSPNYCTVAKAEHVRATLAAEHPGAAVLMVTSVVHPSTPKGWAFVERHIDQLAAEWREYLS